MVAQIVDDHRRFLATISLRYVGGRSHADIAHAMAITRLPHLIEILGDEFSPAFGFVQAVGYHRVEIRQTIAGLVGEDH